MPRASEQETSTILATPTKKAKLDGAALLTPPVLWKSPSLGSKKALWRSADELKTDTSSLSYRSLRRDLCEFAVAKHKLDYCQKCKQRDQVLEPRNARVLGHCPHAVHGVGPHVPRDRGEELRVRALPPRLRLEQLEFGCLQAWPCRISDQAQ